MIEDDDETSALPPDFRLRPSRNQKQRSKLSQAPEVSPAPMEPAPAPEEEIAPPPSKKFRLKRSGHRHDDLTAPLPESPNEKKKRISEY
ncbi:MAG: hypothetical protein ACXV97_01425 [Chthoniobacterales bacterium]